MISRHSSLRRDKNAAISLVVAAERRVFDQFTEFETRPEMQSFLLQNMKHHRLDTGEGSSAGRNRYRIRSPGEQWAGACPRHPSGVAHITKLLLAKACHMVAPLRSLNKPVARRTALPPKLRRHVLDRLRVKTLLTRQTRLESMCVLARRTRCRAAGRAGHRSRLGRLRSEEHRAGRLRTVDAAHGTELDSFGFEATVNFDGEKVRDIVERNFLSAAAWREHRLVDDGAFEEVGYAVSIKSVVA